MGKAGGHRERCLDVGKGPCFLSISAASTFIGFIVTFAGLSFQHSVGPIPQTELHCQSPSHHSPSPLILWAPLALLMQLKALPLLRLCLDRRVPYLAVWGVWSLTTGRPSCSQLPFSLSPTGATSSVSSIGHASEIQEATPVCSFTPSSLHRGIRTRVSIRISFDNTEFDVFLGLADACHLSPITYQSSSMPVE
ncbi:hypothetical protein CT0861_12160, partial [Colletotrichum tofieldiae]